jgi:hypothetical protein
MDARLVVLGVDHPYSKEPDCPALRAAKSIFESRGNAPRIFRNTLVFLAIDQARLQDLDEAVRRFLAWESILADAESLDLTPHQRKQAENQKASADSAVTARLPEAYQWLLVPAQAKATEELRWESIRLTGADALAVRASKKLKHEEFLVTSLAGTRLRMELERVPLWRGNHVAVRQLAEDFARYVYLPRIKDSEVLLGAVRDGLGLLLWQQDSFAYADSYDEAAGRYVGLRGGQAVSIAPGQFGGLLVKPDVAATQIEAERAQPKPGPMPSGEPVTAPGPSGDGGRAAAPAPKLSPTRYYGSATLDPERVVRDAGKIAEEVVAHLVKLVGANVTVTIEIEANVPAGVPDNVVRIVTENGRTLKFSSQGFERE